MQVFECLIKLIDETDVKYSEFVRQSQFIALKCVHNLKQLGFNVPVEKFENYEKVAILKKIWQAHSNTPKGLEAMAYICIGYNIYLPMIWNGILKQMVALHMVTY